VRARRLRPDSVPKPADSVRQAAPASSVAEDSIGAGHRTNVLRPTSRQNANRDPHQRHAAQRRLVQLALHVDAMTSAMTSFAMATNRRRPLHIIIIIITTSTTTTVIIIINIIIIIIVVAVGGGR